MRLNTPKWKANKINKFVFICLKPSGHIEERSDTPVKKLKKKKKHLRKNKLAPSDDEFELSDVQNTPKKQPIPWVRSPSPRKMLEDQDVHGEPSCLDFHCII